MVCIFDVHVDNGAVDSGAYGIEMAVDFGIVGPLVRLQVIPKAQSGNAQKYRCDQGQR
jgi:hypothetical protein